MKRRLLVALPALLLAGLAFRAFYWEPASLQVNEYALSIPSWPSGMDGLRIALLSDLHVGSPGNGPERLEDLVRRVNELHPDVVLLAGDYVIGGIWGGTFVPPERTASILKGLRAPLGVHAVLGNHDWWFDGERVGNALRDAGLSVLEDEALRLERGAFDFWLVGLGDLWERKPDVASVLESIPAGGPILALTHNPDLFPEIPSRVQLTLAGHTHGGQVKLPFLGTPIVPSRFGDLYVRGWIVEGERHLFVTSGVGTSIFPVRFRVPPEIALVVLSGEDGRDTD